MSGPALVRRWASFIDEASRRTGLPADWIRAVLIEESGGRTMMAEGKPIMSSMGAVGLMQLMPDTWKEMQSIYKLGPDPTAPRDNILAGAAYLRTLYWEYGYPGMFAAYNDGPGMIEAHRRLQEKLPKSTRNYVLDIASILRTGVRGKLPAPATILVVPDPAGGTASAAEVVADVVASSQPLDPNDNDDDYYGEE